MTPRRFRCDRRCAMGSGADLASRRQAAPRRCEGDALHRVRIVGVRREGLRGPMRAGGAVTVPAGRTGERETEDVVKGVARMIRAVGKRVGDMDVDGLPLLVMLADEADRQLAAAARQLHDECGYSWAEIGARMGITRQAAQQRFASMRT